MLNSYFYLYLNAKLLKIIFIKIRKYKHQTCGKNNQHIILTDSANILFGHNFISIYLSTLNSHNKY